MTLRTIIRQSLLFVAFSLFLFGAAAGEAKAQCPSSPFGIDLKTGLTFGTPPPQVTVLSPPTDSNFDTWREAVLKINLTGGCTQANIVVEYEGKPTGWSLNLGDSPTNNGFGGDSGTTPNAAELEILDDALNVYGAFRPTTDPPGTVDRILRQEVQLKDSAIKFVVRNQFLSISPAYTWLQTPAIQRLFAIPDAASTDGSNIYLGINRVISGPGNRVGTGARRVLITLQ
jgi:hypothetical protein